MEISTIGKLLGVGLAVLLLAGCQTISEESCAYDDPYEVGMRGAMENRDRADYLADILKDCGKHGVEIDQAALERGFDAGTARFCVPENGFAWGRAGRSYNGVCRSLEFDAAYADGQEVHEVDERRKQIVSRMGDIRSELESIESDLDEKELSDKDRRAKERAHARLLREREDLGRELRALPRV